MEAAACGGRKQGRGVERSGGGSGAQCTVGQGWQCAELDGGGVWWPEETRDGGRGKKSDGL